MAFLCPSLPEQGGQAGDQAGQVHPHQGPAAAVWLATSTAAHGLPQLGTASQDHQASDSRFSLPESHFRL